MKIALLTCYHIKSPISSTFIQYTQIMYSAFGVSVAFCAILRVNSMAIDQNPNNLIKIVSNVFPSDVVANATSSLPMVGGAGNFQTRYPGGRWPDQAPNTGDMIYRYI